MIFFLVYSSVSNLITIICCVDFSLHCTIYCNNSFLVCAIVKNAILFVLLILLLPLGIDCFVCALPAMQSTSNYQTLVFQHKLLVLVLPFLPVLHYTNSNNSVCRAILSTGCSVHARVTALYAIIFHYKNISRSCTLNCNKCYTRRSNHCSFKVWLRSFFSTVVRF